MGSKVGAMPLLLVGFLLASCASPRGLDEPPLRIPALKAGYGRVYFTRPAEYGGAAVQPEIRMNNEVVGRSVPGGFTFVDRPPGKYAVTTATEVERGCERECPWARFTTPSHVHGETGANAISGPALDGSRRMMA